MDHHRPYFGTNHCPDPVFETELYDPGAAAGSGSTTPLAPSRVPIGAQFQTPRLYHLAMLLRDGRVLVIGGQQPNPSPTPYCAVPNYPDARASWEIDSPPYLYKGYRPFFTATPPTQVDLSVLPAAPVFFDLAVAVQPGHTIAGVSVLRPAALTHHFDNDQRMIELAVSNLVITPSGRATFTVRSPDEMLAPPGYYMLFVLEAPPSTPDRKEWVPTVAEFVLFN